MLSLATAHFRHRPNGLVAYLGIRPPPDPPRRCCGADPRFVLARHVLPRCPGWNLTDVLQAMSGMASASAASTTAVAVRQLGARRRARDYLALGKHRLSALVALTATAGYGLRSDESPLTSPAAAATAGWATAGTFLTALSANTLNQMYEIRSDALMGRTRARPLPAGRLSLMHAGLFAAATAGVGVGILQTKTNDTASALGAANIALYAGVYTPLKAVSVANTWVGAVVGAVPPMLGWAAASGGDLSLATEAGAYHLGAALFLWQIPHFHALAVMARADYAAARLRMLAVANPVANARWARLTAAALVPFGAGLAHEDVTSGWFGLEAAAGGAWLYARSLRLSADPSSVAAARPLFRASVLYLPVVLAAMLAHKRPRAEVAEEVASRSRAEAAAAMAAADGDCLDDTHHEAVPWVLLAPFPFLPIVPLYVTTSSKP